jgi:hypothetical protein
MPDPELDVDVEFQYDDVCLDPVPKKKDYISSESEGEDGDEDMDKEKP